MAKHVEILDDDLDLYTSLYFSEPDPEEAEDELLCNTCTNSATNMGHCPLRLLPGDGCMLFALELSWPV